MQHPERPYAVQDPYQYRDPAARHELEHSPSYHPGYAPQANEPRHFTFDDYDQRYGAPDLANFQQYSAPVSPRSPVHPEPQPAQGYPSHAQYPNHDQYPDHAHNSSYAQYPSHAQYPNPTRQNVEPAEYKRSDPAPYSNRYDIDRYASPSRDVADYRQPDYIPERKNPKVNHHSSHLDRNRYVGYPEQSRDQRYYDYDRGYSSADEYAYRPQGRYEPKKRQQVSRKHSNEHAKYEIPPPDYTMNRYDDRYRMDDLARALPPAHKSGRAAQKSNNYGRSADDRGIKYHKANANYSKYGAPDFDYKGFQKRTSQMKQLNQRAIEQARPPPPAKYDRSRPAYDDTRYRSQYPRY